MRWELKRNNIPPSKERKNENKIEQGIKNTIDDLSSLSKTSNNMFSSLHHPQTSSPAKVFTVIILFSSFLLQAASLEFNYTSFDPDLRESDFDFHGEDPDIYLRALQITRDTRNPNDGLLNSSGRIIYKEKFELWKRGDKSNLASFQTTFVINIAPMDGIGEGLAFILTNNPDLPINSHGRWLGIVNETTNGSPENRVIAVEFDTRKSAENDLDDNHVGLDVNGAIPSVESVSLTGHGVNLSSGLNVLAAIRYDGKAKIMSINLTMGNKTTGNQSVPVLTLPIDLSKTLSREVYFGFSGATGIQTQLNCIKSWSFSGQDFEEDSKPALWIILTSVLVCLVLISGSVLLLYICRTRQITRKIEAHQVLEIDSMLEGSTRGPRKFRLGELRAATSNFDPKRKLGEGGFGSVFRGVLKERNEEIAVKRISEGSHQGEQEFVTEVTTIGRLSHRNLVRLIGWCHEKRDLLLVYEYMPNGSLDKLLFHGEESINQGVTVLSWPKRLNIICGVAHALSYLHDGCHKRVFHRDVKSSNVMLDSDYNARLGDFGLARTIQRDEKTHHTTNVIAGTPGYIAPEYYMTGRASGETDVYGFGVFIMEVVCGRRPYSNIIKKDDDNNNNKEMVDWLWNLYGRQRILDAVDPRLNGEVEEEEVEDVLRLGLACCHPNPNERPPMRVIVQILEGEAPPPIPPLAKPAFMWPVALISSLEEFTSVDLSD